MGELIEREVVLNAIQHLKDKFWHYKTATNSQFSNDCLRYIEKKVNLASTIDAVPVETLIKIFGGDEPCNFNGWDEYSNCDYCEKNCENHSVADCWVNAIRERWFDIDEKST